MHASTRVKVQTRGQMKKAGNAAFAVRRIENLIAPAGSGRSVFEIEEPID
jgi:hypothetical protein